MRIYRSIDALPAPAAPTAVAIGNFDGVHRGHVRILDRLVREGRERGLRTAVLTFSPHPERVFGAGRILMLQTLEQRLETLARYRLDAVCVQSFRHDFASLAPGDFVREVLVRALGSRVVVVGPDFRFGRGRRGGVDELDRFGRRLGFDVRIGPPVKRRGECVSSSAIRGFLAAGRVERAAGLLGRPYAVEGDVVAGAGRGRSLGYPTANISTPNEIVPPGVFVTSIEIAGRAHPSMTNVGTRPTFGAEDAPTIETYVFGLRRDLYGESVRLRFFKRVRGERTFASPADLKARLRKDAEAAHRFFAGRPDVI